MWNDPAVYPKPSKRPPPPKGPHPIKSGVVKVIVEQPKSK